MSGREMWKEDKLSAVLFGVCLMLIAMALVLLPFALWEAK